MPDTTRINWNGITNRLCYDGLVWCGVSSVESGADSSDLASLINSRSGTVFSWRSWSDGTIISAIVEIPSTADLVTEANAYDNSSSTDIAEPVFFFYNTTADWPVDDEYAEEEQWYLEDINWDDVVNDAGALGEDWRGHENVLIGIVDTGVSCSDGASEDPADSNHPDLMDVNRFTYAGKFGRNFGFEGMRDELLAIGHGTGVTSLIVGSADNEFDGSDHWGMVGINTISPFVLAKVQTFPGASAATLMEATLELWQEYGCHVVNFSQQFGDPVGIWEWNLMLMALTANGEGEEEWPDPPLIICSAGNFGAAGVRFPARYAFVCEVDWVNLETYGRGYHSILSAGASRQDHYRAGFSCFSANHNYVSVVAPGLVS